MGYFIELNEKIIKTKFDAFDTSEHSDELTEWDQTAYRKIISVELDAGQKSRVVTPLKTYPKQHDVLAIHWHPEFIPLDLIEKRITTLFPNMAESLIIPTQHNVLMSYDRFAGVEVDCYSKSFNRKVQLLLHFERSKTEKAYALTSMLEHTRKYRSTQLLDLLHSITSTKFETRLQKAAGITGADAELVKFVRINAQKLEKLFSQNESITPVDHIKNKLLSNYFDELGERYDQVTINRAKNLINTVKKIVKSEFPLDYFYRTEEVIEEARMLGCGIVVPHPEQFWPILLAEYDVDGYEVWNPQSRQFTEFLIGVVNKQNNSLKNGERPILVFMGDDTHMSEKIKPPEIQNPEKAVREIGIQDAWDELPISKSLIAANNDRSKIISQYKSRLET